MARQQQRTGRRKSDRDDRKPKKKVSLLDQESITYVDYKDVNLLRRFMSERAKIRARRVTGNDAQQQREVAKAIRVAREMALLPYSVRQVTHRSKGKRDRDDRPMCPEGEGPPRPSTGPGGDGGGELAEGPAPDRDVASPLETDPTDAALDPAVEVDAGTEVEESTS
jgi:small subunit ribosomal protein S18